MLDVTTYPHIIFEVSNACLFACNLCTLIILLLRSILCNVDVLCIHRDTGFMKKTRPENQAKTTKSTEQ